MSFNANRSINSSRGRGKVTSRGRAGRGRGRGRPHSVSLSSRDEDSHSNENLITAHDQSSKRRPSYRTTANVGGSAPSDATVTIEPITSTGRTMEKELPPHIAGTAVDAQTLASRVQELAISGHSHSSSIESRFTMSLNWADEEDDPDSLPSLDDWKVPKPTTISKEEETTEPNPSGDNPPEAINMHDVGGEVPSSLSTSLGQADTPTFGDEGEDASLSPGVASDIAQQSKDTHSRGGSGGGMAASIWAPKSPTPSTPKTGDQQRNPSTRGRATYKQGTSETPHHQYITPKSLDDAKVAQVISTPTRNRRPHARPIITSDALAQISRTLGQRATT